MADGIAARTDRAARSDPASGPTGADVPHRLWSSAHETSCDRPGGAVEPRSVRALERGTAPRPRPRLPPWARPSGPRRLEGSAPRPSPVPASPSPSARPAAPRLSRIPRCPLPPHRLRLPAPRRSLRWLGRLSWGGIRDRGRPGPRGIRRPAGFPWRGIRAALRVRRPLRAGRLRLRLLDIASGSGGRVVTASRAASPAARASAARSRAADPRSVLLASANARI